MATTNNTQTRVGLRWPPLLLNIVTLIRLLPQAHPRYPWFLGVGIIISAVLPIVIAILTGLLIGSIPAAVTGGFDSDAGRHTLTLLTAVSVFVVILRVLMPLQAALATTLGRHLDRYLQERVMAAVGRPTGIAHLEDDDTLDRLRVVRELGINQNRPSLAVTGLTNVLPAWLQALGSAAILIWFHWWLGLLWLAMWPIVVYYMQREYLKVGQVTYGQSSALRRSEYMRDLAFLGSAAKEIRIWGMLDWLLDRFEAAWQTAIQPVWAARRPSVPIIFGTSGAVVAINLLSFGLLAWAAIEGNLSLGALAVFIQALQQANGYTAFNDDNAHLSFAAVTVPKVLALDEKLAGVDLDEKRPLPPLIPQNALHFQNVSFHYPGAAENVFTDLTLHIPAGRSLAIVGVNGAGKTSLIKLLCGLYEPTAGQIMLDNLPLAEIDVNAWHRHLAVLFQDFVRYQLSVRDNIAFGAPELAADMTRLRQAAQKADVLDLIESLPYGWDTVLSPEYSNGIDLSGGQWQRVALARALFAVEAGARVLILDEPTAALDVRAEARLYDRFLTLTQGLTTILISHRFSTVRRADRIIVLDNGRIVEDGSHEALLAENGRYAHMFRLQAARFNGDQINTGATDA